MFFHQKQDIYAPVHRVGSHPVWTTVKSVPGTQDTWNYREGSGLCRLSVRNHQRLFITYTMSINCTSSSAFTTIVVCLKMFTNVGQVGHRWTRCYLEYHSFQLGPINIKLSNNFCKVNQSSCCFLSRSWHPWSSYRLSMRSHVRLLR